MPITTWVFKSRPETRHIGPMAQDFAAAFALGIDDKHIATVDAEGVALAAIQGLYAELKERDATIAEQQRAIAELRERVSAAESLRGDMAAIRAELADIRETSTQITARAPAAADGLRADAAR